MSATHTFDPGEVDRFEHEVWSRCAPSYVESFGALTAEAIAPLLDAAGVTRGSRVLDVGTGPGLAAAAVVARGGEVIGIDFSEAMLAQARRRYPEIEFRQGRVGEARSRWGALAQDCVNAGHPRAELYLKKLGWGVPPGR